MEAKQERVRAFLASLTEARSQVARIERRIRALRDKSTAVTPVYGKVGSRTNRGSRGRSELWNLLCDEEARLTAQMKQLLAVEHQAEAWIDLLPKDGWRMVLRYRYLDGMGYPQIVDKMSRDSKREYSETTIFRLHREALQAAAALWPLD